MYTPDRGTWAASDYDSGRVAEHGIRIIRAIDGPDVLQTFARNRTGFWVLSRTYAHGNVFTEAGLAVELAVFAKNLQNHLVVTHGLQLTLLPE